MIEPMDEWLVYQIEREEPIERTSLTVTLYRYIIARRSDYDYVNNILLEGEQIATTGLLDDATGGQTSILMSSSEKVGQKNFSSQETTMLPKPQPKMLVYVDRKFKDEYIIYVSVAVPQHKYVIGSKLTDTGSKTNYLEDGRLVIYLNRVYDYNEACDWIESFTREDLEPANEE